MFISGELLAQWLLALIFNSNIALVFGAQKDAITGVWWPVVSTKYPKYQETTTLIRDMVKKFPDIVAYYSAGKTVTGKEMWVIHLAENVKKPRPLLRPMVKQVSSMHGDEVVGRALLLMLAVDIVKRYKEKDARILKLLQTTDIHLMPSVNPDGFEEAIQSCNPNPSITGRRNKNKIDLNRNFPDQFVMKKETDPNFYKDRQPETLNMMKFIKNYPFVLSTNLHGGDVVASYPFDSVPLNVAKERSYQQSGIPSPSPDEKVFRQLALDYSKHHKTMYSQNKSMGNGDNCISDIFRDGITNGADWYNVRGGMQDFNYVHSNCFEITIELSCCKYPPNEDLIIEWGNNKESLYNFMESVHWGVKGIVTDHSGNPIKGAQIIIKDIDKIILTTSKGEYWRLLVPGKYQIKVAANKYQSTPFKDIEIKNGETARLDFTLNSR